jgi:hypothetical protein
MVLARRAVPLLSAFALLAGCAGTNFVRPAPNAFSLGKATQAQVIEQLGEPLGRGTMAKNEANIDFIRYAYAATGGEPLEEGVIPARAMVFFFTNGVLVGEDFASSFKSDHSNFDDTKVPSIVKGQSTRADVIRLLGPPTGRYIPPVVKATSGEAVGYSYGTTRGSAFTGLKVAKKALIVSFDEKGQVSNLEFTSTK